MSEAEHLENTDDYFLSTIDGLREERLLNLVGKYIIICDSRYNEGQILYLQDRQLGSGNWTKFLSNALGLSEQSARELLKKLHYNNPRMLLVTPEVLKEE